MIGIVSNPIMAKIKYINKEIIETISGISGICGKSFHKAMQTYYGGNEEYPITNESEAIIAGKKVGMEYLVDYNDGFIEFSKTIPNKEKAYEIFKFLFDSYVKENSYTPDIVVATELKLIEKIDVEWRGKQINLPIKLKGFIDLIERTKKGIVIVDYKTCANYSESDKIDGAKMLQAVEYFFLVYAYTGEAPYSMKFKEIKYTQNSKPCINKDCKLRHLPNRIHTQTQEYEIVYAENDLFFDFYFRYYEDVLRILNGEAVFPPNVYTMFDNEVSIIAYIHRLDEEENVAKLMKQHNVNTITEVLKEEIRNAGTMRKMLSDVEQKFIKAKNIDYKNMKTEEKIQTKLLEHGIPVTFDSVIKGATVELFQFTPAYGLKMSKIKSYVEDIEQVLGISNIRVLAPIPNTTLVGFEIPKKVREFPNYNKKSNDLIIGLDNMGKEIKLVVEEMPHLLVAGTTGSGKSVFLRQVINQLSDNYEIDVIDPKGIEFDWGLSDHTEIALYFQSLVEEMEERYKIMKTKKVKKWNQTGGKSKIVIIDEYNDLFMSKEKVEVGKKEVTKIYAKETKVTEIPIFKTVGQVIDSSVKKLAQKSRSAGIHIILATQRPSTKVLDGDIKANFVTRVSFQLPSKTDSNVVLDQEGAEKLQGKGDGLLLKNGTITRFQAFNI